MSKKVNLEGTIKVVPLSYVHPDPIQPREDFEEEEMKKLKESIEDRGIMSPITVEHQGTNNYLIIDGERRYRTAIALKMTTVPINILKDKMTPIERNVIRFQLQETHKSWTVFEKAKAMSAIKEELGLTIDELAKSLAIHKATCQRYLQILSLDIASRKILVAEKIPFVYIEKLSCLNSIMPETLRKRVPNFIELSINKYHKGFIKSHRDFEIVNKLVRGGKYDLVTKFFTDEKKSAFSLYLEGGQPADSFMNSFSKRIKHLNRDFEIMEENKIKISEEASLALSHLIKTLKRYV